MPTPHAAELRRSLLAWLECRRAIARVAQGSDDKAERAKLRLSAPSQDEVALADVLYDMAMERIPERSLPDPKAPRALEDLIAKTKDALGPETLVQRALPLAKKVHKDELAFRGSVGASGGAGGLLLLGGLAAAAAYLISSTGEEKAPRRSFHRDGDWEE